jgi:hypothetical protein
MDVQLVMPSPHDPDNETISLFCARCSAVLHPGSGDFFQVTIEAVADPWPPCITREDLEKDIRGQIEEILANLEGLSEQEALDQVYRRLVLHLCNRCFRHWIENPISSSFTP